MEKLGDVIRPCGQLRLGRGLAGGVGVGGRRKSELVQDLS